MDNPGKLFGQIAAEAGVTSSKAKIAVYLLGLARDGRTLEYAATSLRRSEETIKEYCREFHIDMADYKPFAKRKNRDGLEPRYVLDTGHA